MEVNFDNMRRQMVHSYNAVVDQLNSHIENGDLIVGDFDLERLYDKIHDLKMHVVTLVWMSGENETFGEVGDDNTIFSNLKLPNAEYED